MASTSLLGKIGTYSNEVAFCFRFAADYRSRILLAANTLRFHAANTLGLRYPSKLANSYRVKIQNSHHDIFLRPFGGDLYLLHEVFLSRYYEVPVRLQNEALTIVDLGANIGLASLFL